MLKNDILQMVHKLSLSLESLVTPLIMLIEEAKFSFKTLGLFDFTSTRVSLTLNGDKGDTCSTLSLSDSL